ncbi:MAG TPA: response regulator [Candidatus Marinimicrobia bacterium]|nr:response regulator [Candidatus Neomarinimicrobiota bacterium]
MGKKKKILVVVDSPTIQKFSSFRLKMIDLNVSFVKDEMQAVEMLSMYRFDLLIVDLNMSNMDGIAFVKTVRLSENYADVPLKILTSEQSPKAMEKNILFGADVYLHKPIDRKIIQNEIIKPFLKLGVKSETSHISSW